MNNIQSFYDWCVTKYENKDNRAGDLVKDMKGDSHFPRAANDKCIVIDHLRQHGACKEALGAFNHAWNSYVKEVLKSNSERDEARTKNRKVDYKYED